ncbi:GEVED domain-containing protein [Flavobacterium gelidilacus]|uniref:Ig-like domain-containing protein n=1 Tax=Flavobacterium gelidilacus TaxID=206041 RepID=UPI00047924D1|nr:GEVED domain-containing protein [Flavobacterium gelidilacus]
MEKVSPNLILNVVSKKICKLLFLLLISSVSFSQADACSITTTTGQLTVGTSCNYTSFNTNGLSTNYWTSPSGCGADNVDDAWGWFTATSTTTVIKYNPTGNRNAVLHLFSGSCSSNMTALNCSNIGGNGVEEIITQTTTIGQKYVIRVQRDGNNGNMSGSICVYGINCPTTAGTISGNQYLCTYGTSTATFSSTQSGGVWSSSNNGIASVNASTGLVTALGFGTATITYTIGGSSCPTYTATRIVYVSNGPASGPLSLTGSTVQCVSSTTTYTVTPDPYSSSYTWSYQGNGAIITPAVDGLSASVTFSGTATSGNIRVQSTNGCGISNGGQYLYVTITPLPSTPSTNNAYSATCTGFVAQWGYSNNATSYIIDVSLNNTFTSILSQYNGFNVGNNLNYSFNDLNPGTTYYYRVRASNACGTSSNSSTMNYATATGASNPGNPSSNSPQCNSVTLTRSGTPPTNVTWYWQTTASGTSTANSGATYNVTTSGTYYIRARNSNGCWSNGAGNVTVNIASPTTITTSPLNTSIIPGANTSFTVVASNSPTSYTWQVSTNGGTTWTNITNGGVYSNATTSNLNITSATLAMNGYRYRASATNACGTSAYSNSATLTVTLTYCTPTTQTRNIVYINRIDFVGTLNDISNTSTFSSNGFEDFTSLPNKAIQAQGEGVNIILNNINVNNTNTGGRVKAWIDWNKDGVFSQNSTEEIYNPGPYAGANLTFGFIIPSTTQPGQYRIRFRVYNNSNNGFGYDFNPCESFTGNNYSDVEDYLFEVVPSCSANIVSVTEGASCGSGPVTISAIGTSNTISYRWYVSETSTTPIAGATGSTYTTPSLTTTTTYYVTAFNGSCESVVKTPVVANITTTPTISITPQNPVICGENAVISIVAGGDKETVTLVNEDFENNTLGTFNNSNNDPNDNTVDTKTAWQIKSSSFIPTGGIVWYPAISSGIGNNKFALATSDINPIAGNTIENSLTLINSVNTNNFINLRLKLKMFYSRELSDNDTSYEEYVKLQVSTNNGTNWTDVANILTDIGIGTRFATLNYDLSSYVNNTNLKIRIVHRAYSSSSMWLAGGVAVDDIKLYGEKTLSTSFNYNTNVVDAFMDYACTIPYISGSPATTIYIRPTVSQLENAAFIIPVSTTLSNGCVVNGNVNVTNNTKLFTPSASNSDWNNASNWKPVGVPTASNCIVIYENTNMSNTAVVGKGLNLTVKPGKTLNIATDNSLVITDFIKVENTGTLQIENNANLVQINNVTNTGNIIYKRTAAGIKGSDYVYWSSPVNNQAISTIYTTPAPGPKYEWSTLINNGNGTGGNISQGNWVSPTATMATGKGYIIRGSSSFGMAATSLNSSFIGRPNNGNIGATVNRGTYQGADYNGANGTLITSLDDNHNLIGNPYPSAINAYQFINDNSGVIKGTIKLWKHGINPGLNNGGTITNPFYGNYSYNYSASDYMVMTLSGNTEPAGSNIIKAGQAFFVEMQDGPQGSGTVYFDNKQRRDSAGTPYANDNFFKNANQENDDLDNLERHRIWLDILDTNNTSERALVGYIEGATMDDDNNYDAIADPLTMGIYSLINNKPFIIQGRSLPFDDNDQVAIGFNVPSPGTYKIAINKADGLFLGTQDVYLKDEELNIYHDLKTTPYTFIATAGNHNNRFKLVYKTASVLSNVTFNENEVQITKNKNIVDIISGNETMENVKIFDIRGRLIDEKTNIKSNSISIDMNNAKDQVLIVNIITSEGIKVTKKIL